MSYWVSKGVCDVRKYLSMNVCAALWRVMPIFMLFDFPRKIGCFIFRRNDISKEFPINKLLHQRLDSSYSDLIKCLFRRCFLKRSQHCCDGRIAKTIFPKLLKLVVIMIGYFNWYIEGSNFFRFLFAQKKRRNHSRENYSNNLDEKGIICEGSIKWSCEF